MILATLAALLLQPVDASAVGFYRSTTTEVGAAIELEPDGHFLYGLDYGAVSEGGEGTWRVDGNVIRLTATKMEGMWKEGAFKDTPLRRDGRALLLDRYGVTVRFEPDGPLVLPTVKNEKIEKGK